MRYQEKETSIAGRFAVATLAKPDNNFILAAFSPYHKKREEIETGTGSGINYRPKEILSKMESCIGDVLCLYTVFRLSPKSQ